MDDYSHAEGGWLSQHASPAVARSSRVGYLGGGGGGGGSGQGIGGGGGYNNSNTRAGQDEFTIEEYQASLQNFLSHGGGHK